MLPFALRLHSWQNNFEFILWHKNIGKEGVKSLLYLLNYPSQFIPFSSVFFLEAVVWRVCCPVFVFR